MKTLITGAGGFIGSHLVELLIKKGYLVRAFVRYNSSGNWGWLEHSSNRDKIEVYKGDIRDYDSVKDAMKDIEVVFHGRAHWHSILLYSPLAYVKTNVEGTYNVLQAAKEHRVDRVAHTSTSEIYGTAQYVPIDENHPFNPQSPYAASKAAADHLALSYYRSFGLPVTVIRPFNTFGPRQSARAVIPTIISQIASGKQEIKLGILTPTRDLNYVLNTVEGFYSVGLHGNTVGETINIGSNREISIGDLARLIGKMMKQEVRIQAESERLRPKNSEVERLLCDFSKAESLASWRPTFSRRRIGRNN